MSTPPHPSTECRSAEHVAPHPPASPACKALSGDRSDSASCDAWYTSSPPPSVDTKLDPDDVHAAIDANRQPRTHRMCARYHPTERTASRPAGPLVMYFSHASRPVHLVPPPRAVCRAPLPLLRGFASSDGRGSVGSPGRLAQSCCALRRRRRSLLDRGGGLHPQRAHGRSLWRAPRRAERASERCRRRRRQARRVSAAASGGPRVRCAAPDAPSARQERSVTLIGRRIRTFRRSRAAGARCVG